VLVQFLLFDSLSGDTIISGDCFLPALLWTSNLMCGFQPMHDDWHQVRWSLVEDDQDWNLLTKESLKYSHAWEIRVVERHNDTDYALDGFISDLDHSPEHIQSLGKQYPRSCNTFRTNQESE
jgi:hypothetical protein